MRRGSNALTPSPSNPSFSTDKKKIFSKNLFTKKKEKRKGSADILMNTSSVIDLPDDKVKITNRLATSQSFSGGGYNSNLDLETKAKSLQINANFCLTDLVEISKKIKSPQITGPFPPLPPFSLFILLFILFYYLLI